LLTLETTDGGDGVNYDTCHRLGWKPRITYIGFMKSWRQFETRAPAWHLKSEERPFRSSSSLGPASTTPPGYGSGDAYPPFGDGTQLEPALRA